MKYSWLKKEFNKGWIRKKLLYNLKNYVPFQLLIMQGQKLPKQRVKQHLSHIWSSVYEKVKQHWGWVEEKSLHIKKACSSLVPKMKAYLIYFLFHVCVNREKISFTGPDFVDSETVIWRLTSLTDFYKRVHLLFK